MFNAEQLLGKMMAEMVGSGSGYKKHKKHKSRDMMHSLTSTLLSGKGLMTAVGLGVGAYEILKSKQGASPPPPGSIPPPPTARRLLPCRLGLHHCLVPGLIPCKTRRFLQCRSRRSPCV